MKQSFLFLYVLFIFGLIVYDVYFHQPDAKPLSSLVFNPIFFGGGFMSGAIHSISGMDHYTALFPVITGRHWEQAGCIGAVWGLGHGLSTSSLAVVAYNVKDPFLSYYDYLVAHAYVLQISLGITLLIVGWVGLSESIPVYKTNEKNLKSDPPFQHSTHMSDKNSNGRNHRSISLVYFLHGFILGLSWDGLPSLAPSLIITSMNSLLLFLCAYITGTLIGMGGMCSLLGYFTSIIDDAVKSNLFISSVGIISSLFSLFLGIFWIFECAIILIFSVEKSFIVVVSSIIVSLLICLAISNIVFTFNLVQECLSCMRRNAISNANVNLIKV